MQESKFLRRPEAADYLKSKYGFGSSRTLAKMATLGGGPTFRKFGRIVFYSPEDLDAWVASRMSGPMTSTSDKEAA
jgi:hypothetical protein